jgi:hypothetical protein
MVKIYNARDITEAHIIRGMLEAHGIEAYVNGYYLQGGVGELAAHDYASVSVLETDVDQAKKLVREYDNGILIAGETDEPNRKCR